MDIRFRRLYFVFVLLIIYVFCAFIYNELVLQDHSQFISRISNYIKDYGASTLSLEGESDTLMYLSAFCPNMSIIQKKKISGTKAICVPHRPSLSACKFARKIFSYNGEKRNCEKDAKLSICEIKEREIKCSYTACGKYFKGEIGIHVLNGKNGVVETAAYWTPKNIVALNETVWHESKRTIRSGYYFLFLSCAKDEKMTQLLLLNNSPLLNILQKNGDYQPNNAKLININIVMFDSLARGHFYRSLIKTVETFNAINSVNSRNGAEALDFELFQALHGHSAENARGLFNGTVFPIGMTDLERETQSVGIEDFFRYFKLRNYHTLYQDDMCWEAIWGFRNDVGGAVSWEDLFDKFSQASIDDSGLMHANCKIFKKFGVEHIFSTSEEEYVCYNSQQHNAYFLEYLINHFSARRYSRSISYSALNVAHDYGGVRVQAIDKDLAHFVDSVSQLDDTLTVILADHGNTYTDFVYLELEGRYEMHHPSLFMIVPNGVQQFLGADAMNSLRSNQKRLLTMIDLHHSFKYLADRTYPEKGVFDLISNQRDCSTLPLRFPNYCVCEGWNIPVDNTTELVGHLEFAVGQLNNIITKSSPRGKCKRLVPYKLGNAFQRKVGDRQLMSFDIHVQPGFGFPVKGEKINVELVSKQSGVLPTYEMGMTSWDRISKFGTYRECSDADVKFRLCVCDKDGWIKKTSMMDLYYGRTSKNYAIFDGIVKETFDEVLEDTVAVVVRTYHEKQVEDNNEETEPHLIAVTFEAINFSLTTNQTFKITVQIDYVNNLKPMTGTNMQGECSATVPLNTVIYLCTLSRKWHIWQAEYTYKVYVI